MCNHINFMNKKFYSLLITSALLSQAYAQFPGGGMGGGFGRPGQTQGQGDQRNQKTFVPGTADDDRPRGNGKLAGLLMDSTSNKPVEYATVALMDKKTRKPVDGTTSDEKGRFSLSKLPAGEFYLQVSFMGYQNETITNITIAKGTDINVGIVKMNPDVRTLSEVTVTGQAAVIEEKVDRLVYNADKDIASKGGDATDIMRKVPMLTVDLDGNVSLRGSQNVRVLINNKPSTIVASSVADALKQIPADMIKSVEVITSPSAKYDAEGSAGIINIITKKNTLQGATLNVDLGVGNRGANMNVNGSYRQGKMGFNLGGFGRASYNVKGAFENTQSTFGTNGTTRTIQMANTKSSGMFGHYQLGWDYDIDKNTSLSASLRYGVRNQLSTQDNLLTQTFLPKATSAILSGRDVETKNLSGTLDANISYQKTYKTNQELSVLGLYSRNNNTNNFVADLLNGTDMQTIIARQKNDNLSYNQESTVQVDYQTPIKRTQLLEIGGKGIFRQVNSDYAYYNATPTGEYILDKTRPANTLNYDQNVTAGYLSYTYASRSKWTIKAGGRYEYTFINAKFNNEQAGDLSDIPDYGTFVPSINLSKGIRGGKTIKASYNRRLQRPGIQFLNPNVNASNPTNISVGNPYLSPELTDNFELGFSGQVKALYLNATMFARRTDNSITSVRDTLTQNITTGGATSLQQVIRTTYRNIGHEDAYGVNLFLNATFFSKLQIGGGVDLYHTFLTNNGSAMYGASNSGWVVSGRLFSNLTLKNGWGVQAFGGARGRQVQLQGYQGSFAFYNMGVRKEFKSKRGSIGFAAENFLNYPFKVRSESMSPIFSQQSVNSMYNANFRITFNYRLGKMSFDGSGFSLGRRKKSISNDDVKSEGGGNDNGGGQQQGGGMQQGGGGGRPRQ